MQPLPDPLVVMAIKEEGGEVLEASGVPVLYTGVGKVNAACGLSWKLAEYAHSARPLPLVINFGTAGGVNLAIGHLVACNRFMQRDMDASALGFEHGVTPFDPGPKVLEFAVELDYLPSGVCGSGDSFSTDHCGTYCDVVDMEAYGLAKVCWLQGARFVAVKYVSDNANVTAVEAWQQNLTSAASSFLAVYQRLVQPP
jgi:adenosylhomocysteine nucleosidase